MASKQPTPVKSYLNQYNFFMPLEPRIMFDAAAAATAEAAANDADHGDTGSDTSTEASHQHEIAFIDTSVKNSQELLQGLTGKVDVITLQEGKDALSQITAYLASQSNVTALHLFSHGTPGSVSLGDSVLTTDSLSDHANQLESWKQSLTADADILLYGCDIAQGDSGEAFISQLAAITGADIAASTNATGSADKGGDWILERATGPIEAGVLAVHGYGELLDDGLHVESIVRQTPTAETTNATSVKYLVTFSEAVSGVTADSFVIAPGSVPGATVQLVTAISDSNGTQYEVTIGNLPKGVEGTLNIDIADHNIIKSVGGNKDLSSLATTGRDDSYRIDTAINPSDITGIDVGVIDLSDIRTSATVGFTLSGTADAGDTVRIYIDNTLVGTTTTDNSGVWNYTYSGAVLTAGNHQLLVRNSDAAGNSKSESYTLTIDTTKPTVVTGDNTSVSDIIVEIKFDEVLAAGSLPSPADFIVKVNGSTNANTAVTRVTVDGDIVRLTLAKDVANDDSVTVSYDGTALKDAAGNAVDGFSDKVLANLTKDKGVEMGPTVTAPANHQWYSIGDSAVKLFDGDFTLSDTDDTFLERATVTIKNGNADADILNIAGTLPSGITWSTAKLGGNLVLTLEGHATLADYQTALGQITFKTTTGTAAYNVVNRSIEVVVNDGQQDSVVTTDNTREIRVLGHAFPIGNSTTAYVIGNVSGFTTPAGQTSIGNYDLVGVNLVMGTLNPVDRIGAINFNDFTSWNLNALGFNPTDGHLYAARQDNGNRYLVRIDADGTVTRVSDAFDGADGHLPNVGFVTGDIDNYGIMWLYNGNKLQAIDVNAKSDTFGKYLGTFDTKNSGGSSIVLGSDMAFNSAGMLYSAANNALITVMINRNANGKPMSITTTSETINGLTSAAMQYCDEDGFFYFSKSGTKLGRLHLTTKVLDEVDADPSKTLPGSGDAGRLATIRLDYGDAGTLNSLTYRTTFAQNGPRHNQLGNETWLGLGGDDNKPEYKNDAIVSSDADSDTDDNGITSLPALRQGMTTYSIDVAVTGKEGDTLIGWIDFDKDGKFEVNEAASFTLTQDMNGETVKLIWAVPAGITTGDTYARFRIATPTDSWKTANTDGTGTGAATEDTRSYGALMNGEVEDYKIAIQAADTTAPTVDAITVVSGGDGPRSTPVGSVEIKFSESVIKVDYRDFVLTRNGVEVSIPPDTPITGSGNTWYIDLSKLSSPTGEYQLTVKNGSGDGITDDAGNVLGNQSSKIFYIDTTAPVIDLDTYSGSRDWAAASANGAKVSLDNNDGPAEVVEKGIGGSDANAGLKNIQVTVSGLRDGDNELLIFNGTDNKKANGGDSNFDYTIGSMTVSVTYSNSVFTFTKQGGGLLSEAEASAIVRSIEYQNSSGANSSAGKRTFIFTAEDNAGVKAEPARAVIEVTGSGTAGPDVPTVDEKISKEPNPTLTGEAKVPEDGTLKITVDKDGFNEKTYTWTASTLVTYPLQYDEETNTWTLNIPPEDGLPDGVYDVEAKVTDEESNSSYDITEAELTIDTLPPVEPTVDAASLETHDTTPVISGTANVLNGEKLTVKIGSKTYTEGDGHLVRTNENWMLTITDHLNVDDHTVEVTVTDAAGNSTTNTSILAITPIQVSSPTVNEASDYAVFEVTTLSNAQVKLGLQDDTAKGGTTATTDGKVDYLTTLEYSNDGGTNWQTYTPGNSVVSGSDGRLLVRTPIVNDDVVDDNEQYQLIVTPVYDTDVTDNKGTGTATIKDDGTGTVWAPENPSNPDGPLVPYIKDPNDPENIIPDPDKYPGTPPETVVPPTAGDFDDDRSVTVNNITVNEASAYGVFEVTGNGGQKVTLELQPTGSGEGHATPDADYTKSLEYFDETSGKWKSYTVGELVEIPTSGELQVRVPIINDDILEGSETFKLVVKNTGGQEFVGTGTITDDGTGTVWVPVDPATPDNDPSDPTDPNLELVPVDPNGNPSGPQPGEPIDPSNPNGPKVPELDDDRQVSVNNITVNEASPYGVFEVEGPVGQDITFELVGGSATGGGVDFGTPTGSGLEYSTDGGNNWTVYDGTPVKNVTGKILVRTPIINDDIPEGDETFELKATPVGGQTSIGTATIKDDGTGDILDPNTGDPLNPGEPGYPEDGLNNDWNQPPVAVDDIITTDEDTPVSGNLLGNDNDPDGDTMVITKIIVGEHEYEINPDQPAIIIFDGGVLEIKADGSYTFTPEQDWHGTIPTVTYTISDGKGGEDTAKFEITVKSVNDNPVAQDPNTGKDPGDPDYIPHQNFDPTTGNYAITTPEDTPVSGKVTGTDVDGDDLTYKQGKDPEHGKVTVRPDGSYTYTPDPDFYGKDSFTVEIEDGEGGKTTTTIEVTVTPLQDINPDTSRVVSGETVTIPVLANDNFDGKTPVVTVSPGDLPKHGKVTINPDGSINYIADGGFSGTDTFTYTVTSGGVTEKAIVTITVEPPPPPLVDKPEVDTKPEPPAKPTTPDATPPVITPPSSGDTAIPAPPPVWTPSGDGSTTTDTLFDLPQQSYNDMPIFTISGVVVQGGESSPGENGLYLVKTPSSQIVLVDEIGSFNLPTGTFRHSDADAQVSLEATLADGRPLPSWLSFDPDSGRFTGKPPKDASGVMDLKVSARDDKGNVAFTQFLLRITSDDNSENQTVQDNADQNADGQDNQEQDNQEQENTDQETIDLDTLNPESIEALKQAQERLLHAKKQPLGRPSLTEQLRQQQPRSKQADLLASLQYVVAKLG